MSKVFVLVTVYKYMHTMPFALIVFDEIKIVTITDYKYNVCL